MKCKCGNIIKEKWLARFKNKSKVVCQDCLLTALIKVVNGIRKKDLTDKK